MTLLDAYGRPLPEQPAEPPVQEPQAVALACGNCGSTNLYHQTGFGGHWAIICNHCGEEILKGRDGGEQPSSGG